MSRVFPYERFEVRVAAAPSEVARRLAAHTQRPSWWKLPSGTRVFAGRVGAQRFELRRAVRHTNSFVPIVYGTLRPEDAGTVVSTRLRVHPLVPAILALWLTGGIIQVYRHERFIPELVFFVITFLVAVTLVSYGFWSEAPRTKAALREVVTGERPEP